MKTKIIMRSSSLFAGLGLLAFLATPALAQDYGAPSGYGAPGGYGAPANIPAGPSAEEIQKMQQQAMQQAQGQAQGQGQGQGINVDKGIRNDYKGINIDQGIRNQPMDGQNFGPGPGVEAMQQKGEAMQKQAGAQQLKGLQQGAKGMEQGLKQFENLVKQVEKAGGAVSAESKTKYEALKQQISQVKNAKSADELGDTDLGSLQGDMQDVMEEAQTAMQNTQQLKGLKQGMKGMEQGLKQFETQLARISKQKVAIPADITGKVASIKTQIAAVKAAKTWAEAESAGVEDLQDSMDSLNDYRDQLEVLMRLPQMQKQMDQQMARLNTEVKKTAAIATKLKKQGIDMAEEQAAFAAAVGQLKTVRDNALAQVKSGDSEAIKTALDDLEENFFGQMTDVMEHSRVIQTMAGLSRFPAELKKNLTAAQTQVNQLKRKKVNTAELESLLSQAKAKGAEVSALIKAKPLDEDAVMEAIAALEDLRTQFDDKAVELGGGADMPWESGPDQFKAVGDYNLDQYLPKK